MKKTYLLLCTFAAALAFASCSSDDGDDDDNGSGNVSSYTHCPDSHHPHAIDLGLPSGTKWACCNVGASTPEAGGDYFAWGETKPKSDYSWDTYKWGTYDYNNGEGNFTKYTNSSGKTTLDAADDAATQNMGKRWRMPTAKEFNELIGYCYGSWTEENGIPGYKFTSVKNAASVFLPASGDLEEDDGYLGGHGFCGYYWTSSLSPYDDFCDDFCDDDHRAYYLWIDSDGCDWHSGGRDDGQSVRAVCP